MSLKNLVVMLKPADQDKRRALWEPVNGGGVALARIDVFEFSGVSAPSGNHYHKRTEEVFFVAKGKIVKMVLEDLRTGKREVFRDLGVGTRIAMPVLVAHAMVMESGTIMVAGCSTLYDPADKDLHPYALMDEAGQEMARPVGL